MDFYVKENHEAFADSAQFAAKRGCPYLGFFCEMGEIAGGGGRTDILEITLRGQPSHPI